MKTGSMWVRWNLGFYVAVAILFSAGTAFAQASGKSIRDKVGDVLNKMDTLQGNLEALCDTECQGTKAGGRFKEKAQRLGQTQQRVKREHGRVGDDAFTEVVRKRAKRKSDGVCNADVQICISDGGVNVLAANDPEYDDARGGDIVADLSEVEADVDELNNILAGRVPPSPVIPDVTLQNADYFFPASMRPSSEVVFAGFIANLAAEKAAAIADHFCDQTAVAVGFGGNGSAACSVVEGVHQVLDAAYQILDFIGQDAMSAEVTGTYNRAKNIFDQLAITDNKTDGMKDVVDAMGQKLLQLEENQKYIIWLLTRPQGQRPNFPGTPTP